MCLAVPMKLTSVSEQRQGWAELDGVRHAVDLSLVDRVVPGDYVIVHAGFAIERLDTGEAQARIDLFRSLARVQGP